MKLRLAIYLMYLGGTLVGPQAFAGQIDDQLHAVEKTTKSKSVKEYLEALLVEPAPEGLPVYFGTRKASHRLVGIDVVNQRYFPTVNGRKGSELILNLKSVQNIDRYPATEDRYECDSEIIVNLELNKKGKLIRRNTSLAIGDSACELVSSQNGWDDRDE